MSGFENLPVVDHFYQTSLFFPMPIVFISTLCEDGRTTLGPYSLVQPYYVAVKDYDAMLLSCRNSSNTAQNILRNGKCAICFVDDKPKTFKECVKLSRPGVPVTAFGAVSHWGQWAVILVGYIGIIFVMFSGARRLELRQDKNYGNNPEYQKYVKTVPILLPFTRIYSVKKHKRLVA